MTPQEEEFAKELVALLFALSPYFPGDKPTQRIYGFLAGVQIPYVQSWGVSAAVHTHGLVVDLAAKKFISLERAT